MASASVKRDLVRLGGAKATTAPTVTAKATTTPAATTEATAATPAAAAIPTAVTAAAATAEAAAATPTAAAATTAAATVAPARRLGPRNVHADVAALQLGTVQLGHRLGRLGRVSVRHKRKAPRPLCLAVNGDEAVLYNTSGAEMLGQLVLCEVEGEVAHKQAALVGARLRRRVPLGVGAVIPRVGGALEAPVSRARRLDDHLTVVARRGRASIRRR